jgi:hypothetical protein
MLKIIAVSSGLMMKPNAAVTNQRRINSQTRERNVMKKIVLK